MRTSSGRAQGILPIVLAAALVAGCGQGDADGPEPTGPAAWPAAIDLDKGAAIYAQQCGICHGPEGRGGSGPQINAAGGCELCSDYETLREFIDGNMPLRNPRECVGECARNVAAYIFNGFSSVPNCAVGFEYESIAADRFAAAVVIANASGTDIAHWRVDFSFPNDQRISAASNTLVEQEGRAANLQPAAGQAPLASGTTLRLRFSGSHGGVAEVPDDTRLEAPPCFAAPP